MFPKSEIPAAYMSPVDVTPQSTKRIMLKEKVVVTVIKNRPIRIVAEERRKEIEEQSGYPIVELL